MLMPVKMSFWAIIHSWQLDRNGPTSAFTDVTARQDSVLAVHAEDCHCLACPWLMQEWETVLCIWSNFDSSTPLPHCAIPIAGLLEHTAAPPTPHTPPPPPPRAGARIGHVDTAVN